MGTYLELIQIGQLQIKFILDANNTNGQLAMFEVLVPPGGKFRYLTIMKRTMKRLMGLKA